MEDEIQGFYKALGSLLKALVGILIAFFAIFLFAYFIPVILRVTGKPEFETLTDSMKDFTRWFSTLMGGFLWAIFGLIVAIFVIWALATFLPAIFKIKPWRHIKIGDEALDTLRLRYAKGDITKKQYYEMKRILEEEEP